MKKNIEIASDTEVKNRKREIQLLINIQEPDPEYQPFILTDEATVFEVNTDDEKKILKKYSNYFNEDFTISLHMPLWQVVDAIKSKYEGWPDECIFLNE